MRLYRYLGLTPYRCNLHKKTGTIRLPLGQTLNTLHVFDDSVAKL